MNNSTNFTSIDLELNQPPSPLLNSGSFIIQVGWCVGNLKTGEILEKQSRFVQIPEPLNPFITTLTNITQEMLDTQGGTLDRAYQDLRESHLKYNCHPNPITWGGGDSKEMEAQLTELFPESLKDNYFCFGRRWFDTKTVFQLWCLSQDIKMQSGLAKSMTKAGLKFKGTKHRADDDAENTFILAHHLLKKFRK